MCSYNVKTPVNSVYRGFLVYVTRFELATFWSVARRSIQLSYTYLLFPAIQANKQKHSF